MLGKIVSGVIISSLLTFPQTTVTSFANECKDTVNGNKNNKILEDANEQRLINDLNVQLFNIKDFCNKCYKLDKDIEEYKSIKQKVEARLKQIEERELEEQKRMEEEKNSYNIDFLLTYYSRHPSENAGYNCTASGSELREGIVANNNYPLGTLIQLEDGRIFEVADRGGTKHFNNWSRLDVFVDTYNQEYVRNLGTTKIKGKVIKWG